MGHQEERISLPSRITMDNLKMQRQAHRAPADRMLERYPMSNSELYSSDISSDEYISDLVYRNLRFKTPMGQPYKVNNSAANVYASVGSFENRSHSKGACVNVKCNKIRTNPRFRPSSFHCYGQLQKEFVSDGDSSDDQLQFIQRNSFSNRHRRARLKCNSR